METTLIKHFGGTPYTYRPVEAADVPAIGDTLIQLKLKCLLEEEHLCAIPEDGREDAFDNLYTEGRRELLKEGTKEEEQFLEMTLCEMAHCLMDIKSSQMLGCFEPDGEFHALLHCRTTPDKMVLAPLATQEKLTMAYLHLYKLAEWHARRARIPQLSTLLPRSFSEVGVLTQRGWKIQHSEDLVRAETLAMEKRPKLMVFLLTKDLPDLGG